MKIKPITFLLAFTFLFSGSSVVFGDDLQDAKDAIKRKDYEPAYKLFLPLAEQGFASAQNNLGDMYKRGTEVPQDYKEAIKWYRLAAEQEDCYAQYKLGIMYTFGNGVPRDDQEAVKWWKLSAEQGYVEAQRKLDLLSKNFLTK